MRAVIFDMDGVLVDVSWSYSLTVKRVVERFLKKEIPFSLIQFYKSRGGLNNDWDLTESILKDLGIRVSRQRIIGMFQEIYLGNDFTGLVKNEKWLLEKQVLEWIKRKFKTGIVTGRPRLEAMYVLDRFDVQSCFSVLITMDDIPQEKAKPDPYGIQLALRLLDVREAFYIGDTVDDMIAARKAGVVPIGIASGDEKDKKLEDLFLQNGAQKVLKDINDIWEVLG